jgi:predicted nucleotidyltransferase
MKSFKDHEYVQTKEGLFFCVVGYTHPPDRVISYLKYVPSPRGKWGRGNRRFRRILSYYSVPSLLKTFQLLKGRYPQYLYDSHVFNIEMSAVPLNYVKAYYSPREKLNRLFEASKLDSLQQKVVELVSLLSEESGVPANLFGITGSMLIDIHRSDFSDIDLTIHGLENSQALREALLCLLRKRGTPIKRLSGKTLEIWCKNKSALHPITVEEAKGFYKRKWNRGLYKGKQFSIHPIKLDEEVTEKYGDRVFIPQGIVEARATVSDTTDAMFLPSTYSVEEVTVMTGPRVIDIREVATYEGLYADLAKVGEKIIVKGKLEKVLDKRTSEEYHRILVGSPEAAGTDFIRLHM